MPEDRRLAAIMFTDIVGYTALMGKDEIKTLDLLRQHHHTQKSIIKKYQGVFVKEIGDGLLAYFHDPNQAVQCSIEIQNNLRDLSDVSVRIGLHWAEIFVEDDDIYGDGVNIASRIESIADPGGVYVSEDVVNSLESDGQIDTKYLGSAKLKNIRKPTIIYAIQGVGLPVPSMKRFHELANPKKKFAIIPTVIAFLVLLIIALVIVKFLDRRAKIIKAEASLDKIEDLIEVNWRNYAEAYTLAKETETVIPNNPMLRNFIDLSSVNINITTDPSGARVFYKLYDKPEDEWYYLGITPIDSIQLPKTFLRWKIEKEGYETVLAASLTYKFSDMTHMTRLAMFSGLDFHRILDKKGTIPEDMTHVPGREMPYGKIEDFYIDKYEVTNQEYKKFVEQGGYQNQAYWPELIFVLADTNKWQEAVQLFVDRTGLPGPSTWTNQQYVEGEQNFPVTGINWFEANAYAHFVGKSIPTKDHWGLTRGEGLAIIDVPQLDGISIFTPFSNFHGEGPVNVGSMNGITPYGAYDLGGNVREWCWNESVLGRWMRGGAWNDNPYMLFEPSQASPFDRSERNGFRCAMYLSPKSIPETAFAKAEYTTYKDIMKLPEPISDEQFKVYEAYYEYDRFDLQDTIVSATENEKGWRLEKVEFNTAYDNERMTAFVFIPTNTKPPYQSVIYGPGGNAWGQENSNNIENFFEFSAFLEFYLRHGRAVVFPIIKGTFERKVPQGWNQTGTHQRTRYLTRMIMDYRRCLDYMETRNDFIMDKVAFYGVSAGPSLGAFLTAVDPRIKANIFFAGGIFRLGRPEANIAYFLPRVTIPTLMINGKYDSIFGLEVIMDMFNLLGTPEKDKKLVLLDSDHLGPMDVVISEINYWLDQQFGEVDYSIEMERLEGAIQF